MKKATATILTGLILASILASANSMIDVARLQEKVASQKEMIEKIYEIVQRIEGKL